MKTFNRFIIEKLKLNQNTKISYQKIVSEEFLNRLLDRIEDTNSKQGKIFVTNFRKTFGGTKQYYAAYLCNDELAYCVNDRNYGKHKNISWNPLNVLTSKTKDELLDAYIYSTEVNTLIIEVWLKNSITMIFFISYDKDALDFYENEIQQDGNSWKKIDKNVEDVVDIIEDD